MSVDAVNGNIIFDDGTPAGEDAFQAPSPTTNRRATSITGGTPFVPVRPTPGDPGSEPVVLSFGNATVYLTAAEAAFLRSDASAQEKFDFLNAYFDLGNIPDGTEGAWLDGGIGLLDSWINGPDDLDISIGFSDDGTTLTVTIADPREFDAGSWWKPPWENDLFKPSTWSDTEDVVLTFGLESTGTADHSFHFSDQTFEIRGSAGTFTDAELGRLAGYGDWDTILTASDEELVAAFGADLAGKIKGLTFTVYTDGYNSEGAYTTTTSTGDYRVFAGLAGGRDTLAASFFSLLNDYTPADSLYTTTVTFENGDEVTFTVYAESTDAAATAIIDEIIREAAARASLPAGLVDAPTVSNGDGSYTSQITDIYGMGFIAETVTFNVIEVPDTSLVLGDGTLAFYFVAGTFTQEELDILAEYDWDIFGRSGPEHTVTVDGEERTIPGRHVTPAAALSDDLGPELAGKVLGTELLYSDGTSPAPEGGSIFDLLYGDAAILGSALDGDNVHDGMSSLTLLLSAFSALQSGSSSVVAVAPPEPDEPEWEGTRDDTSALFTTLAGSIAPEMHGRNLLEVDGNVEGDTADEVHADAKAESVFTLTSALLAVTEGEIPTDWTAADYLSFVFGFAGIGGLADTPEWAAFAETLNAGGPFDPADLDVFGKYFADGVVPPTLVILVSEAASLQQVATGLATEFAANGDTDFTLDYEAFSDVYVETDPPTAVEIQRRKLVVINPATVGAAGTYIGAGEATAGSFGAVGALAAANPVGATVLVVGVLVVGGLLLWNRYKKNHPKVEPVTPDSPPPAGTSGADYEAVQLSEGVQALLLAGDTAGAVDLLYAAEREGLSPETLRKVISGLQGDQYKAVMTEIFEGVFSETETSTNYFKILATGRSYSAIEDFAFADGMGQYSALEGFFLGGGYYESAYVYIRPPLTPSELDERLESLPPDTAAVIITLWQEAIANDPAFIPSQRTLTTSLENLQANDPEGFNAIAVQLQDNAPAQFVQLLNALDPVANATLIAGLLEALPPETRVEVFKDLTGIDNTAELTPHLANGDSAIFNALTPEGKGSTIRVLYGQDLADNNATAFLALNTAQGRADFLETFASGLGGGADSVQAYAQSALLRLLPPDDAQDALALLDADTVTQIFGTLFEYEAGLGFTSTDGKAVSILTPVDDDSGWEPVLLIDGEIVEPEKIVLGNSTTNADPVILLLLDPDDGHGEKIEIEIDITGEAGTSGNAQKLDEFIHHYRDLGKVSDHAVEHDATPDGQFIRPVSSIPAPQPSDGHVTQRTFHEDGSVTDTTRRLDADRATSAGFASVVIYVPSTQNDDTFVSTTLVDENSGTGEDPSFAVTSGGTIVATRLIQTGVYDVDIKLDDGRTITVRISLGRPAVLPNRSPVLLAGNVVKIDTVANDTTDDLGIKKVKTSYLPSAGTGLPENVYKVTITFENGKKAKVYVYESALKQLGGDAEEIATAYAELLGQLPPAVRAGFINNVRHDIRAIPGFPGALAGVEFRNNNVNDVESVVVRPSYLSDLLSPKPNDAKRDFQAIFIHELGHLIDNPDAQTWADAMTLDATSPTNYAQAHYLEDFAESYALWYRIKTGKITGEAAENIKSYLSHRFELLDNWAPALATLPQ